jgi:lipopolysaccharide biosynthesis regulator YciM
VDIWLLSLVLVAILIGWVVGRWMPTGKIYSSSDSIDYSESYVKGLNYLLTDDSQKAIETFSELIKVNADTVETHIVLGNLFRSRGEADQAIKIHQNLLARPDLSRKQRNMAIGELATDYLKAGLLDRAEKLFKEMIQLKPDDLSPYRKLLDLYITEKSWDEAIKCAQILYDRGDPGAAVVLSQCHCELADSAMKTGNNKQARESLAKALDIDPSCVRAALLLIKHHMNINNVGAAKKIFRQLTRFNPEYINLYIAPAKEIYSHGSEPTAYQNFLQEQYQKVPSTRLAIALIEYYASINRIEEARQFLSDVLKKSPSFEAFEFALRFLKSDSAHLSETWESLSTFLLSMQNKKAEYVCSLCGYESHAIQWNCPSCRNWSTMKPV